MTTITSESTSSEHGPTPRRPLRADFTAATLQAATRASQRSSWWSRFLITPDTTNPMQHVLKPVAVVTMAVAGIIIISGGVMAAPTVSKFVSTTIAKFSTTIDRDAQTGRTTIAVSDPGCDLNQMKYEVRPGVNVSVEDAQAFLLASCERADIQRFMYGLYPTHFVKPFDLSSAYLTPLDKANMILPVDQGWNSYDAVFQNRQGVPTLVVRLSNGEVVRTVPADTKLYSDTQTITPTDLRDGDHVIVYGKPMADGSSIEGSDAHVASYIKTADIPVIVRMNHYFADEGRVAPNVIALHACLNNGAALCSSGAPTAFYSARKTELRNVDDVRSIEGKVLSIDGATVVLEVRSTYDHVTATLPTKAFDRMNSRTTQDVQVGDILQLDYYGTTGTIISAEKIIFASIM